MGSSWIRDYLGKALTGLTDAAQFRCRPLVREFRVSPCSDSLPCSGVPRERSLHPSSCRGCLAPEPMLPASAILPPWMHCAVPPPSPLWSLVPGGGGRRRGGRGLPAQHSRDASGVQSPPRPVVEHRPQTHFQGLEASWLQCLLCVVINAPGGFLGLGSFVKWASNTSHTGCGGLGPAVPQTDRWPGAGCCGFLTRPSPQLTSRTVLYSGTVTFLLSWSWLLHSSI